MPRRAQSTPRSPRTRTLDGTRGVCATRYGAARRAASFRYIPARRCEHHRIHHGPRAATTRGSAQPDAKAAADAWLSHAACKDGCCPTRPGIAAGRRTHAGLAGLRPRLPVAARFQPAVRAGGEKANEGEGAAAVQAEHRTAGSRTQTTPKSRALAGPGARPSPFGARRATRTPVGPRTTQHTRRFPGEPGDANLVRR